MPDLSTLGPGHRSTLDAIFWPIDEGYNDWLEPLKGRQRRFQGQKGPRMRMQFRHPECFIDERNGDLGPYVRYLIALRFVLRRRSPKSSWSQILAANRERTAREVFTPILKLDDEELLESFQSAFYQDSNAWKTAGCYMHGRLFDRILAMVNGERGDLTPLTRAQFLEVGNLREGESLESRTLGQFQHWLENGVHPPNDDLRNLMCEELLRSNTSKADSRDDQLEQIFKLLRRPQREGHVINVFGRNCATGLRAFSTALLEELVRHRGAGDPDSPVGLIYLRLTRSQLGEGVPTPASVVRLLRNAFGLPLEPDREGGSRPIDLHADLEPITRAMSIYKTIVVVDGLATSEGPVAALLDMIRNTQWIELLRVLIQPHQPTLLRRGASYPSRLVILSSEPVSQLEPWMIVAPQRLGAVPEEVDARSLLVESKARAARLAALSAQLDARVSTEGLDQLFPLNDDQREALFVGRQPH